MSATIASKKCGHLRAVHVEPPVTDEVLLVEEGAVGAEEAVLDEVGVAEVGADVEGLALGLGVGVVALDVAVAGEGGVGGAGVDGVVLPGRPGDRLGQRLDGVHSLLLAGAKRCQGQAWGGELYTSTNSH